MSQREFLDDLSLLLLLHPSCILLKLVFFNCTLATKFGSRLVSSQLKLVDPPNIRYNSVQPIAY